MPPPPFLNLPPFKKTYPYTILPSPWEVFNVDSPLLKKNGGKRGGEVRTMIVSNCQIRHYLKLKFVRPQFISHTIHYPIKENWNYDVDLNELSFPSYSFLSCIRYLVEKFITFHLKNSSHQLLNKTYGDTIKSTEQAWLTNRLINCCTSEEADAPLVRHTISCVETGCDPVVLKTVDTDVSILMISLAMYELNQQQYTSIRNDG